MGTKKPISTISYNTPSYLVMRLQELKSACILSEWAFIRHKGELTDLNDPESKREKDHCHLLLLPARNIEPEDIRRKLQEVDPSNPKPLGCMPFNPTHSLSDWYLYGCHDKAYLEKKGERKEFYDYPDDCFIVSDCDWFADIVSTARSLQVDPVENVLRRDAKNGLSWTDVVGRGDVPIMKAYPLERFYSHLLAYYSAHRNDAAVDQFNKDRETKCPYDFDEFMKDFPSIEPFRFGGLR